MFYWSKMYTSQIKPGDTYDKLKKCIKLTDILEIHYLEIPKLFDQDIEKDENDPIVQWMEFLDGKSKGVMEMLAEKNKDIKKAYDLLQIISKDEKARMVYEAREAELRDQLTRIKSAEDKGRAEGREEGRAEGRTEGRAEGKIMIVKNLLRMGLNIEQIAKAAEISVEKVEEIKKQMVN